VVQEVVQFTSTSAANPMLLSRKWAGFINEETKTRSEWRDDLVDMLLFFRQGFNLFKETLAHFQHVNASSAQHRS
jgi:hypothetical protein